MLMRQLIRDINTNEVVFSVSDGLVLDPVNDAPRFMRRDRYWIPYLSEERWPVYIEEGKYVYDYPPEAGPVFYYGNN